MAKVLFKDTKSCIVHCCMEENVVNSTCGGEGCDLTFEKTHVWKCHVTMTKREAYESNIFQLQNHSSIFFDKHCSLHSATSVLSSSTMAQNTTASENKLICANYVDFGKCQEGFGQFSWSKNDFNYFYVKRKVFKKGDNRCFCPVKNLTMGSADIKQFKHLRKQLVNASERKENLSQVLILATSKDMDEQLKLSPKVVDVGNQTNRKICVKTMCAVQCGQAREFIRSSRINCKAERRRDALTKCLCEIYNWKSCLST